MPELLLNLKHQSSLYLLTLLFLCLELFTFRLLLFSRHRRIIIRNICFFKICTTIIFFQIVFRKHQSKLKCEKKVTFASRKKHNYLVLLLGFFTAQNTPRLRGNFVGRVSQSGICVSMNDEIRSRLFYLQIARINRCCKSVCTLCNG